METTSLPHNHGEETKLICEKMPSEEDFRSVSDVFKQLCDMSRLRIFWILCHCEECVINISAITGMSSPAVSHHLKQLKANELITSRRLGKEVYYKATESQRTEFIHAALERLMEIVCPSQDMEL